MGWAADYNRRHAGKAWEIIGYSSNGDMRCVACAELVYTAAILSGDEAGGDGVAPLFSVDSSSWRDDHRSGCGLACDPCGAAIIEACEECAAGIGGAV
jgi:hypothetical protein